MTFQPALFLDRDNTVVADPGYLHKIEDFAWLAGAAEALAFVHQLNIPIFIVTNQGGIARGLFTEQDMHDFNQFLMHKTQQVGGKITDIAFCPHHPKAIYPELKTPCACRKPSAGMLVHLAEKWDIDLTSSIMIGDKLSDVEAGHAAGCYSKMFNPNDNLLECITLALEETGLLP